MCRVSLTRERWTEKHKRRLRQWEFRDEGGGTLVELTVMEKSWKRIGVKTGGIQRGAGWLGCLLRCAEEQVLKTVENDWPCEQEYYIGLSMFSPSPLFLSLSLRQVFAKLLSQLRRLVLNLLSSCFSLWRNNTLPVTLSADCLQRSVCQLGPPWPGTEPWGS